MRKGFCESRIKVLFFFSFFLERATDMMVAVKVAQQEVKERTSHISLIRGREALGCSGDAAWRPQAATKQQDSNVHIIPLIGRAPTSSSFP